MKKVGIIIAAVACVALICGGFWFLKVRMDNSKEPELTEVQKITTRDLEKDYPSSARDVIKFYNRIITAYYGEKYTDQELEQMAAQALMLFDEELAANNPKEDYLKQIRAEAGNYKSRKRSIVNSNVCNSRDVVYLTDKETKDNIAYVTASYFVKENTKYDRTHQEYVLRKDEEGHWKILTFYKVSGKASEDDSDE
ncbi:MAG: hypothetical protein J1D89_04695 [Agathobacter sp.]|nr:hypothetical protein [Agathobacter sp.]